MVGKMYAATVERLGETPDCALSPGAKSDMLARLVDAFHGLDIQIGTPTIPVADTPLDNHTVATSALTHAEGAGG